MVEALATGFVELEFPNNPELALKPNKPDVGAVEFPEEPNNPPEAGVDVLLEVELPNKPPLGALPEVGPETEADLFGPRGLEPCEPKSDDPVAGLFPDVLPNAPEPPELVLFDWLFKENMALRL